MRMISLKDVRPYIGAAGHMSDVSGTGIPRYVEQQTADIGLDMDPDFQRGHVWEDRHRTAFVEHLLRGGRHGRTIAWNSPTYGNAGRIADSDLPDTLVIVDGKQRMTAVLRFLGDEVPVFGGNLLSDFDAESRRDVLIGTSPHLRLQMHVHGLQYRHDLLDLYLQLNEGAIAHAPEEIARVRALRDAAPLPETLR
jgi:hypothetical protein